jgi:hypothetical protein
LISLFCLSVSSLFLFLCGFDYKQKVGGWFCHGRSCFISDRDKTEVKFNPLCFIPHTSSNEEKRKKTKRQKNEKQKLERLMKEGKETVNWEIKKKW